MASLLALALWLGLSRAASAAEPPAQVAVLSMGPGDHPFTRFGHNALLLTWEGPAPGRSSGHTIVYNFGTFTFAGLAGVQDFMAGRLRYWLSKSSLEHTLRAYAEQNRSLVAQRLELDERERQRLFDELEQSARPENRFYDYDYYLDNCSTRVRDALDHALGGELSRAVHGPGRLSFRQHTLRLTQGTPWVYAGLDLALGAPTDRPITRWQELFLPGELHDELGKLQRAEGSRKLVSEEQLLLVAQRAPTPELPEDRRLSFGLLGALLGLGLGGLGALGARRPEARVVFAALLGLSAAALGALGSVFAFFWLFSRHVASHQNLNLLLCPPWALLLALLALGVAAGKRSALARARLISAACVLAACLALLLALLTGAQDSARMLGLLVPVWCGAYAGLCWLEAGAAARAVKKP